MMLWIWRPYYYLQLYYINMDVCLSSDLWALKVPTVMTTEYKCHDNTQGSFCHDNRVQMSRQHSRFLLWWQQSTNVTTTLKDPTVMTTEYKCYDNTQGFYCHGNRVQMSRQHSRFLLSWQQRTNVMTTLKVPTVTTTLKVPTVMTTAYKCHDNRVQMMLIVHFYPFQVSRATARKVVSYVQNSDMYRKQISLTQVMVCIHVAKSYNF